MLFFKRCVAALRLLLGMQSEPTPKKINLTSEEYLLMCLTEECAEVQKAAIKCIRFGPNCFNPYTGIYNAQKIMYEINDIIAIIEMLGEEGFDLPMYMDKEQIMLKKEKVRRYMKLYPNAELV